MPPLGGAGEARARSGKTNRHRFDLCFAPGYSDTFLERQGAKVRMASAQAR
jgi:hypothetical protein